MLKGVENMVDLFKNNWKKCVVEGFIMKAHEGRRKICRIFERSYLILLFLAWFSKLYFKENQAITVYRPMTDKGGGRDITEIRFGTPDDQKDNF